MTKRSVSEILSVALGCATLILISGSLNAAAIRANGGTTFDLQPTAEQGVFTHTVDGIAQVSLLGNCGVHFDVEVRFPTDPSQPISLRGSGTFTSADGATTLTASVEGAATLDPANSSFGNLYYDVRIDGGSGRFAGATGTAVINGAFLFTSASTGKATWTMKGYVTGNEDSQ